MSFCSTDNYQPDLSSVNYALQNAQTDHEPQPEHRRTDYDEFADRCDNNPDVIARARSWIRDRQYWDTETLHFRHLIILLDQMDDVKGEKSAGYPQMDKLERVFKDYEKLMAQAQTMREELRSHYVSPPSENEASFPGAYVSGSRRSNVTQISKMESPKALAVEPAKQSTRAARTVRKEAKKEKRDTSGISKSRARRAIRSRQCTKRLKTLADRLQE